MKSLAVAPPGPERAAILLLALGEDAATEIFRNLGEREIQEIGLAVARVGELKPEQVDSVLESFVAQLDEEATPTADGGEAYVKRLAVRALGDAEAENLLGDIAAREALGPVAELDAKTLFTVLRKEHPRTIAVILSNLGDVKAAEILGLLPEQLQTDVALRIAQLEAVPSEVLIEVGQALRSEIAEMGNLGRGRREVGGVDRLAVILNRMEKSIGLALVERVEQGDAGLAEQIRQRMFTFDDLVRVDDRGIQAILRETDNQTLTLALKTVSAEVREKIFKNISQRASQMIKDDLVSMGPVRLSEVEKAQQTVVRTALRLEEEGRVIIAGSGGEKLV
jgi:flagellar motor switch protein FliG